MKKTVEEIRAEIIAVRKRLGWEEQGRPVTLALHGATERQLRNQLGLHLTYEDCMRRQGKLK